ncbi:MAG: hypothetical protein QOF94_2245, partial [Acidobacteriaceae bacterium]
GDIPFQNHETIFPCNESKGLSVEYRQGRSQKTPPQADPGVEGV